MFIFKVFVSDHASCLLSRKRGDGDMRNELENQENMSMRMWIVRSFPNLSYPIKWGIYA